MSSGFSFFSLLHFWLAALFGIIDVKTYSQISSYGGGGGGENDEGPKIFKAINADLIFPETFNSSNNVISTTPTHLTPTTLATFPVHYPQNSVSDTAIQPVQVTPVIYVTPPTLTLTPTPMPTQTLFAPQAQNDQTIESNRMQVKTQSDYPRQLLREKTLENVQSNDNSNQQQQFTSTGRAVDYQPAYQLDQFMNAAKRYTAPPSQTYVFRPPASYPVRPHKGQNSQYNSGIKVMPYPMSSYRQYQRPQQVLHRPLSHAEIYKSNGDGDQISDRFTPGEAVASSLFTKNSQKHNHNNKVPASSNYVQTYANPQDIYSFPPNIDAKYPRPSEDTSASLASINANSYAPPAAGPIKSQINYPLITSASSNEDYQYNGPVNPAYLTNTGKDEKPKDEAKPMENGSLGSDDIDNDDTIGVLPASAMGSGDTGNKAQSVGNDITDMNPMPMGNEEHDHDHSLMGYDTGKEYPTPPPGWVEEQPEHNHGPTFPHITHSHDFPDIIYDDHHHHDFHYDHHHPIQTTLPPPPPLPSEQPQEPRVKKYSYFYIGRKLWYIPLYFTVWFSFYVLWLILKSIARHKVNLPNHYVSRRSIINHPFYNDEKAKEYINTLTVSVLNKIENFQKNYIT